jgi:hypothetical protein
MRICTDLSPLYLATMILAPAKNWELNPAVSLLFERFVLCSQKCSDEVTRTLAIQNT